MKNRKQFIKERRDEGMTYIAIGKILNISKQRVYQLLTGYRSPCQLPFLTREERKLNKLERERINKERNIENEAMLQQKIRTGELLNIAGLGHIQGREFTREAVRRRDNYTCQSCGKIWEEGQRRFDIHHLNGICGEKSRGYDRVTDGKDMITLCHKCHLNLESVREKMRKVKVDNFLKTAQPSTLSGY